MISIAALLSAASSAPVQAGGDPFATLDAIEASTVLGMELSIDAEVRVDLETGFVRSLTGRLVDTKPKASSDYGARDSAVRAFLDVNQAALVIQAPWELERIEDVGGMQLFRYREVFQGVPIYGGRMCVATFDPAGVLRRLTLGEKRPAPQLESTLPKLVFHRTSLSWSH